MEDVDKWLYISVVDPYCLFLDNFMSHWDYTVKDRMTD